MDLFFKILDLRIFFLYNLFGTYLALIIFRLLRIGHLKYDEMGKNTKGKNAKGNMGRVRPGGFELQVHFCAFPSLCLFCYSYTSCNVNIVTRRTRNFFACIDKLVNGFVTTCSRFERYIDTLLPKKFLSKKIEMIITNHPFSRYLASFLLGNFFGNNEFICLSNKPQRPTVPQMGTTKMYFNFLATF